MNTLHALRPTVLDLHKTVLEAVRRDYERNHGVMRDADFLNALVEQPELGWLQPMTSLVAELDYALDEPDRAPEPVMAALRALIAPGTGASAFQEKYAQILDRSPDALVAHVRTMRALKETS